MDHPLIRPRTAAGLLFMLLLALTAARPAAADENTLTVSSQNTLHLSDSQRGKEKRKWVKAQNANYDVNLLQEVMKSAKLNDVKPGSYVFQDTGLKGLSSYKERYAIFYKSVLTAENGGTKMVDLDKTTAKKFARPPSGTLINDGEGNLIWFIDFHAIFGKSIQLRRAEATAMATAYTAFKDTDTWGECDGVVIGGDWNLPATDTGFKKLKAINQGHMDIVPDIKTSLTKAGALSEKYDHFVVDDELIDITDCDYTPLNGKSRSWFRKNVSDHLGITCTITFGEDARTGKRKRKK